MSVPPPSSPVATLPPSPLGGDGDGGGGRTGLASNMVATPAEGEALSTRALAGLAASAVADRAAFGSQKPLPGRPNSHRWFRGWLAWREHPRQCLGAQWPRLSP